MKKIIFALVLIISSPVFSLDTVRIAPMRGPIGTVQISPPNGSAVEYQMTYSGQKTITFVNNTSVVVYIGSHTDIGTSDFPLLQKGSSISLDLKNGESIFFYGAGAGADVRAIFAR